MSTQIKDGGPAYPNVPDGAGDKWQDWDMGMSLRDHFAGLALQGLLAQSMGMAGGSDPAFAAQYAYQAADAMIAAREAK